MKNRRLIRLPLELSECPYMLSYQRDSEEISANILSRHAYVSNKTLVYSTHDWLAQPGINPLWHYLKSQILPYSFDDLKLTIALCFICRKLKKFSAVKATGTKIKSTQAFDRLSTDLINTKTPSLKTGNTYILTHFDEHSLFPFAFCAISSQSIIKYINQFICVFGVPQSIYSDRPTQFSSKDFIQCCHRKSLLLMKRAPYHS